MNLHLGCYNRPTVGWYNTDISMQIRLARVPFGPRTAHKLGLISGAQLADHNAGIWKSIKRLDVSKRFPFADQSVDAVFSSHVFEHLVNPVARNMLRECARILKPTGVFRIVIPDLDQVIAEYDSSQPDVTMKRIFETQQRSNAAKTDTGGCITLIAWSRCCCRTGLKKRFDANIYTEHAPIWI